jgi:hypothetical protein
MGRLALVVGILCAVAAVVVFVFADGPRRWYSGLFFAFLGALMLVNAARWLRATPR